MSESSIPAINDDEEETKKLWRVRRTVMQMCRDRGYDATRGEVNLTIEEFKKQFGDTTSANKPSRNDLMIIVSQRNNQKDQMVIYFPEEPVINSDTVRLYWRRMLDQEINTAIIVAKEEITPSANELVVDMAPKYRMEFFLESELMSNVTEDSSVPIYSVLTPEEKEQFLTEYALEENMLKKIEKNDPVARYYGLKVGQVVKIDSRKAINGFRPVSFSIVCETITK